MRHGPDGRAARATLDWRIDGCPKYRDHLVGLESKAAVPGRPFSRGSKLAGPTVNFPDCSQSL